VDTSFPYEGQAFVWDREKARTNFRKHAVSLEQACQVFFDPFLHVEDASIDAEQRNAAIGMAEDSTLLCGECSAGRRSDSNHFGANGKCKRKKIL
jgi:hypothetical protein